VKEMIVSIETTEEWRDCGAFCVRFYKDDFIEYVVVDDYFPAYANDKWTFAQGGNDGKEIWPMVLEKAYAKFYGTYNYIEAGKI